MSKRLLTIGLLSAGAVSVPSMALVAAQINATPSYAVPVAAFAAPVTAAQADQTAVNAVGGGTAQSTSTDTYQGAAVYDIHVLYNSSVFDVKVSQSNGAVVLKKLSSEQPSTPSQQSGSTTSLVTAAVTAAQADQTAVNAVGGGTAQSTSTDTYQGAAVYDIHVLYNSSVFDVKVSQSNGAVVLKKLSSEQPSTPSQQSSSTEPSSNNSGSDSSPSKDGGLSSSTSAPIAGVTYGVKLTTVPSLFQTYVNQALSQEAGTLKWVRFSTQENSQTQMNVKINLANGNTVKVIDIFSPSLGLLSQSLNG